MSLSVKETETGFNRQRQVTPEVNSGSISQERNVICFASGAFVSATRVRPLLGNTFMSDISMGEVVRNVAIHKASLLGSRLQQRINVLAGLRRDWDGNRGEPVKSHVLAEVVETLRRLKWQFGKSFNEPSLVPTFDGFLQMEWHEKKRSLDIEAVNEGWSAVGTSKTMLGKNEYCEGEFERSDFEPIVKLYLWVTGSELLWPLT